MIVNHQHPGYLKKWRHVGTNKYNGAYYYSIEICEGIIPKVETDRNWVTVNCEGAAADHSIVFIHNNLHPENYEWLADYNDLILVCGVKSTVPLVEHLGTAIYLPLSVNVSYIENFKVEERDREIAYVGRKSKRKDFDLGNVDYLEGLPREDLLRKMARYKSVYAVGRCAIEAKILGCEVLPYDPRYPDPDIWRVVDSSKAAEILQHYLDYIDKGKPLPSDLPSVSVRKHSKTKQKTRIIDHTHPDYIAARNKNSAYYYSKEIVERIIPEVNTDRNWITIKAGEDACDHSICFVHNNRNFEPSYEYLKKYNDIIYIVGLPDMVEPVSKFGTALYLPLSVDVAYVEGFKAKRKTRKRAFVGRKETRRDWKFPEGTDLVEMLPREELLKEMAKYKEVYAIGRTAIEAKILGCRVLPFHPRLPDPELWQVLDNKDAAAMLQRKLDMIDGGEFTFMDLDRLALRHNGGIYTIDRDKFITEFCKME